MGGAVSSVVDVVGDVVGGAVDIVSDAGSWIDDNVLQPALDDPIATAAKVAAVATGNPQLLPVISGAQTVAAGGDLGDVAKAAGTSYVAGEVGGTVGGEVAGATGSQAVGQIAGGAAAGATGAAVSGGDIGTGLLTGGVGSAINQGVNAAVNTGYNLLSGANAANNAVQGQGTTMEDNIQYFDDGSAIQTFDDGSAIVTDSSGGSYVLDTNSGYAQAVNTATGQPVGAASSSLFDNLLSGAKTVATTALKSALLGNKPVTGNTAGQLATGSQTTGGLLGAGVNYFLSQNQLDKLSQAYQQNVAQQQQATQQAVDMSKFTPVGVTTAFGQSQYTVDPTTGRITQAGYTSTPQLQAAQQGLLSAGQAMIPTGNLQQQAQTIYEQQTGLLAPGREQQLAQLRNRLYQRGTSGLATGGTVAGYAPNAQGLMATNPELAAYYNAQAQQNAQLAAASQQQALSQAQGQASLAGSLFGQAGTLESLAQQPLTLGTNLATLQATAGGRAGQLGLLGGQSAATTGLQGQLAGIYGQGQALSNVVNPLAQAAQQGLSTAIGNWLS